MGRIIALFEDEEGYPRRPNLALVPTSQTEVGEAEGGIEAEIGELADQWGLSTFAAAAHFLRTEFGLSNPEIAEDLGVSEDIANKLAVAGLRQLTEAMAKEQKVL